MKSRGNFSCDAARTAIFIPAAVLCSFGVLLVASVAAAGTYYVAPGGSDSNPGTETQPWATVQKAADTMGPGDRVLIKAGTYNETVDISNSGLPGQPISFENYPEDQPVIDGNGFGDQGIIEVRDCSHIRLSGLKITNGIIGTMAGIEVWNADDLVIERCHTYLTRDSGIKVNYSSNVVINNNEIERACDMDSGEEDISIKLESYNVIVSYNHVHHGDHEGIDVKHGAHDVLVVGNYIHHIERQGLYADSWDRATYNIEFRDNIIHDCDFGIGAGAEMDGLLSNVWFVNNVVYNCRGPGMYVVDYGEGLVQPVLDLYFINNTIYNCSWDWGAGMYFGNYNAENVVVRNNIISKCEKASPGDERPSAVVWVKRAPISYTMEYNLVEDTNNLDPNWYIEGQPMFADSAGGDFHLQGSSDAIDAGSDANAPTVDLDGDPRPMGYGFDIGAYEWPLGDIDGNGHLNYADFAILGYQWGEVPGDPNGDIAPLGGDGVVDWQDLAELVVCWPK